jgi:hypothetical protein
MMGRGSARLAVQRHAALIRTIFLREKPWVFQEPRPTKLVPLPFSEITNFTHVLNPAFTGFSPLTFHFSPLTLTSHPRARFRCARPNSLALRAPMIESSPAKAKAAATSARAPAWPEPLRPRISRQAAWLGKLVPPPTVPTMRLGKVTVA